MNFKVGPRTSEAKQYEMLTIHVILGSIGLLFILASFGLFTFSLWFGCIIGYFLFAYYLLLIRPEAGCHLILEALTALVGFGAIGLSGYMLLASEINIGGEYRDLWCVTTNLAIWAFSGAIYLWAFDVPQWRKLESLNLRTKINLKNGTFSISEPWAGANDYHPKPLLALIPSAGAVFGLFMAQATGGFEQIFMGVLFFLINVFSGIVSAHKLHYLFRIKEYERQLGVRLLLENRKQKQSR